MRRTTSASESTTTKPFLTGRIRASSNPGGPPPRLHYVRPAGVFAEWRKKQRAQAEDETASQPIRKASRPSDPAGLTKATDRHRKRVPRAPADAPSAEGSPSDAVRLDGHTGHDTTSSTASAPAPENQTHKLLQPRIRIPAGTGGFHEILAHLLDLAQTQKR